MKGDRSRGDEDPRPCAERLIARRDHGCEELRRKLLVRGYAPAAVGLVLNDLVRQGYLDDGKFCREFARQALEKGHGSSYIRAKLALRGARLTGPPCTPAEESASLRVFLDRRHLRPGALTPAAERAKIIRFLRGRGYSSAAISAVLGRGAESEER